MQGAYLANRLKKKERGVRSFTINQSYGYQIEDEDQLNKDNHCSGWGSSGSGSGKEDRSVFRVSKNLSVEASDIYHVYKEVAGTKGVLEIKSFDPSTSIFTSEPFDHPSLLNFFKDLKTTSPQWNYIRKHHFMPKFKEVFNCLLELILKKFSHGNIEDGICVCRGGAKLYNIVGYETESTDLMEVAKMMDNIIRDYEDHDCPLYLTDFITKQKEGGTRHTPTDLMMYYDNSYFWTRAEKHVYFMYLHEIIYKDGLITFDNTCVWEFPDFKWTSKVANLGENDPIRILYDTGNEFRPYRPYEDNEDIVRFYRDGFYHFSGGSKMFKARFWNMFPNALEGVRTNLWKSLLTQQNYLPLLREILK